jgi:hypothetical protein
MIWAVLYSIPLWALLVLLRVVLIVVGFIVVPIALLYRKHIPGTVLHITRGGKQYIWELVQLPKWAWLWDNESDGSLGDKGASWAQKTKGKHYSFYNQLWWLTVRNPCNNFSRKILSFNVNFQEVKWLGKYRVDDIYRLNNGTNFSWFWRFPMLYSGLYSVIPYGKRCIRIRLGYKIRPEHSFTDEVGGFATSANPFKKLRRYTNEYKI